MNLLRPLTVFKSFNLDLGTPEPRKPMTSLPRLDFLGIPGASPGTQVLLLNHSLDFLQRLHAIERAQLHTEQTAQTSLELVRSHAVARRSGGKLWVVRWCCFGGCLFCWFCWFWGWGCKDKAYGGYEEKGQKKGVIGDVSGFVIKMCFKKMYVFVCHVMLYNIRKFMY